MMGFGGMFPGLTLFLLTTLIFGFAQLTFLYEFLLPTQTPEWTVWLSCYLTFGLGAGLGIGAMKWTKVGVISIGATIGFVLGKLIDLVII